MSKMLAITGLTGKKSGGVLAMQIAKNIDAVNEKFPRGIRAIVRKTSDTKNIKTLIEDVEISVGELTDIEFLKKCLHGADTLIHLAGIHWSKNIIKAAADCHIRRVILVHTTGIYSKYKAAGKEYREIDEFVYRVCSENKILLTICRPTMIYGNIYDNNIAKFIKMVDRLPIMPVVNRGEYELQPVHYADLGKAYYQILMKESVTANRDFILSGGAPIFLKDMLGIIGNGLGKNVKFVNVPFFVAYMGAWLLYISSLGKQDFREKVQRLCEPRAFAHDDAIKAFGYAPMTFEEGIIGEITQYQNTK